MTQLFNYYDRSGDGRIDYKEFTAIIIDGGKTTEEFEQEQARNAAKPTSKYTPKREEDTVNPK